MAFIMSLFSDAEMIGAASGAASYSASMCAADSVAVPNESAPSAEAGDYPDHSMLNPCPQCPYQGLCSDECAAHSFPLDAPWSYGTRFHNLGEYVNMLKHYGWL